MLVPRSVSPVLTFGGFLASCSSVLRRMDQAKEVESRIMIQVRAPTGVGHSLRLLRRVRPTTRHQAAAFLLGEAGARNLEMEHRPNCRPNAEQPLAAVSPPPVASLLGVRPTCLWASQYPPNLTRMGSDAPFFWGVGSTEDAARRATFPSRLLARMLVPSRRLLLRRRLPHDIRIQTD